ncbi:MAG: cysteine-rich KTR domain-containing protein [Lachnospiraceae bacterium]
MEKTEWVFCPVCGQKTRIKLRPDTVLKHFPLFCPKCRQERLINARNLRVFEVAQTY